MNVTAIRALRIIVAALSIGVVPCAMAAPAIVNYQAKLTDSNGQPITSPVSVIFTFWDAQTTGSQITGFSDTDIVTPDSNGICSTDVGDDPGNPIPAAVFAGDNVWLNVNVGGQDIVPRQRIASVPYAFEAAHAGNSDLLGGLPPSAFQDGSTTHVLDVGKAGVQFTRIQDALDSIPAATSTSTWLVRVGPGIYNEHVTMKPYVDIQGSGRNLTRIADSDSSTALYGHGVVVGASNCELRDISVEQLGAGGNVFGVFTDGVANFSMTRTNVFADYTTASGSLQYYLVYFANGSSTYLNDVVVSAIADHDMEGIRNEHSTMTANQLNLRVVLNADLFAYALNVLSFDGRQSFATVTNSQIYIRVDGGFSRAISYYSSGGFSSVTCYNSIVSNPSIVGQAYADGGNTSGVAKFANCQLEGTAGSGVTRINCYTPAFAALP